MGHFIVEGISTQVKSPMKIHGRFYLSKKTPDYKMTHQLFTLFQIICNILTFHFYTFSVIYTFYFYIAFEELTFYKKCSIKCIGNFFYTRKRSLSSNFKNPEFFLFVCCCSITKWSDSCKMEAERAYKGIFGTHVASR